MPKDPIGQEFSCDVSLLKELANVKKGEEVTLELKCVKIGDHVHSGKTTEKMCDLRVVEAEVDVEDDEQDAEDMLETAE